MSKRKGGRFASIIFALAAMLSAIATAPADAAQTTCQQTPPRVAVDVGHSLKRPGATSARGKKEFLFNQRFARELVAHAQTTKDLELVLINGDGQISGLRPRVRQTEKTGADVFLSIHHDSAQPIFFKPWTFEGRERFYADQFSGFSLFVSRENPQFDESVRLAQQIGDAWLTLGIPRTLHHAAPIKGETGNCSTESAVFTRHPSSSSGKQHCRPCSSKSVSWSTGRRNSVSKRPTIANACRSRCSRP